MDESPKQLIGETKTPIAASPGQVAKYDYEYKRYGVCNVFIAFPPARAKSLWDRFEFVFTPIDGCMVLAVKII